MAHLSNYISFFFFSTLLLALQTTARDSKYFSKVTHFDNNNVKETEISNKEAPEVNKLEQQPPFIPETENSYGLYGHDESNQVPSTSYHPSNTNNDAYNTRFAQAGYNNRYSNYNKDSYGGNQYELSDTKYNEEGYNKYYNSYQNNNYKYYNNDAANDKYYNNNNYNANNDRYSYNNNVVNNRYNGEQQRMSDTRFFKGGRYFYDNFAGKKNPTNYGDSSRGVNTNNWYNNKGGNYNEYLNQEKFEDEQENFEP